MLEDFGWKQQLDAFIWDSIDGCPTVGELDEACRYAVLSGGKRIRPRLALSICEDLEGDSAKLLPVTAALEFLHASSLVHDDLPALDNDELRRGQPTCHKVFGDGVALLAGDYLVPRAFQIVLESSFTSDTKLKMVAALAQAYADLCHGQVRDILREQRGDVILIHALKTGSLFSAAAQIGSLAAGRYYSEPNWTAKFGLEFGICFQILDDYLDLYGTDTERGRGQGSDVRNQKETFFSGKSERAGRIELVTRLSGLKTMLDQIQDAGSIKGGLKHCHNLVEELIARIS